MSNKMPYSVDKLEEVVIPHRLTNDSDKWIDDMKELTEYESIKSPVQEFSLSLTDVFVVARGV